MLLMLLFPLQQMYNDHLFHLLQRQATQCLLVVVVAVVVVAVIVVNEAGLVVVIMMPVVVRFATAVVVLGP